MTTANERLALDERVLELVPLIRDHRAASETAVRMAPEVHEALIASGVYAATKPSDVGGGELDLVGLVKMLHHLGYADLSVAWCVLNTLASGVLSARMSEQARSVLFDQVDAFYGFGLTPTGTATVVDEGFDVTGHWPVVSGCEVASWFALACIVKEGDSPRLIGDQPEVRFMLVAAGNEIEIIPTWQEVSGMCGTGSHAVQVENMHVATHMSARLADPSLIDRPAYRLGFGTVLPLCAGAAMIGAATAAYDAVIDEARGRVSAASGAAWRDWTTTQDVVARSRGRLFSARSGLEAISLQLDQSVQDAPEPSPSLRSDLFAVIDHAHVTAREVTSELFTVASLNGAKRGHGAERALRDVHLMCANWTRFRDLYFDAGRVALGLEGTHPFF